MLNTQNKLLVIVTVFVFVFLQSCTTNWEQIEVNYRDEQTLLTVDSSPEGKLYVNDKFIGYTPITTPLIYQQKISIEARAENGWHRSPLLVLIFTVWSFGLFLPLAFDYYTFDEKEIPTGEFFYNQFDIRIETNFYKVWKKQLECKGQLNIELLPKLELQQRSNFSGDVF